MTRAIVKWSLRFRYIVVGLAVALLVFGIAQLRSMPVDVVPEFAPAYVEVQTEALGLSAEEVEQLITVPLEADLLQGVAWLDTIRSQSVPGLSSIVLIFEPGTDVFRARQMVAERLTQAHALPNVSKPPAMLQPLSSTSRVMMVSLTSADVSPIDMSVLARWTIRPTLMGVPGVANVAIWGQRERQLQVLVDPAKLKAQRVSLDQVIETAGNALWFSPLTFLDANTPGTGGFIDTPNQRLGVQHILPIRTAEDLAKVTIVPDGPTARSLRIGDVATVVQDHQPLIGDAIVGDGEGLLLVIEKFPGASTLEVTRGLEDALAALKPGLAGIDVDSTVFRPATFIESAIQNLGLAVGLAFVLVAVTFLALGFSLRGAIASLIAIIVSMVVAAAVLYALGATLNELVVAGLVLAAGVVIDDAVVGIGEVRRRMAAQSGDGDATPVIIQEATVHARTPLAFATVIVVLVTVPAFLLPAPAGQFAPTMAAAYLLAIVASLVVAVTLTPALASLLRVGAPSARPESAIERRLRGGYASLLGRTAQHAGPAFVGTAVVAIVLIGFVGATAVPQLGGALMPDFSQRDVLVAWQGASGASIGEMTRVTTEVKQRLQEIPGVRNVGAHIGRAIASDQVVGIDSGELWVSIEEGADYHATVAAIRAVVDGRTDLEGSVLTYPAQRIDQVLGATASDVTVRVYGHDLAVLQAQANQVGAALEGVSGLADVAVEEPVMEQAIEIAVDPAAAARHGIKPGDVRRAATTLVSGLEVGNLFEDQKVFEVVVRGVPEIRDNVEDIGNLAIDTPDGGSVRLADVASVETVAKPSVIERESVFRRLDVTATIDGGDVGTVLGGVQAALSAVPFPLEYHAEVFSAAADRQASVLRLLGVLLAVLAGILLVLQAAFGRWRLAAVMLLVLPAAASGGALGLLVTGGTISLGLLAGFVAVMAIAVRQIVSLIDRYRRLERAQQDASGLGLILQGAQERMGPVLTTAVATIVALLPIVVLGDVAGLEVLRPMAAVIVGGLVTSTFMTLLIVPTVYLRSGPSAEQESMGEMLAEGPGLSPA